MKKTRLFKTASIVALSAVMCGTALAATACGKKSNDYELTVYIFCSAADYATNQQICNTWAAEYTQKLIASNTIPEDKKITVDLDYNVESNEYQKELSKHFQRGTDEDVFYLSPRYINTWAASGRVLDISKYMTQQNRLGDLWPDAVGFYGWSDSADYMQGERISYNENGANGAGLYTDSGVQVGLYGLPKDYSNFAMAYNGKYFSDQMKEYLQTYGPSTVRNVKGAYGRSAALTYTGGSADSDVITYAVDVEAGQAHDGKAHSAGEPAAFVNIGIPVNIKPYNFYRFTSYAQAYDSGDPIALATNEWAPDGYVVTIPGFPGDTFDLTSDTGTDENAPYVTSRGHTTLTYAEFGALTWATTFFCNTFDWWNADGDNNVLNGTGGLVDEAGTNMNIYGCGQYEGDPAPTLYPLPWLYSNESDFIDETSKTATNPGVSKKSGDYEGVNFKYTDPAELKSITEMLNLLCGQESETRDKISLNGENRSVDVYYGVNSYNFIEMYGAFLEYASTWNGNSENCGDQDDKADNSWAAFRAGYNIFYGSGTWDAQARNDSDLAKYCTFCTMPSPVAEKYALYSHVKGAFYTEQTYAWQAQEVKDGKTVQKYWDGVDEVYDNDNNRIKNVDKVSGWDGDVDEYCKVFTEEEIIANQTVRQDKWGARMDSVGYSVNGKLEERKGTDTEWKMYAAVSLAEALSINEDAQVTLSYGGAQLPNFVSQCSDFLYYNVPDAAYWSKAGKTYDQGAFSKMLTPEGFADTGYWDVDANGNYTVNEENAKKAKQIWDYYYGVVQELNTAAGKADKNSTTTVKEFLADKKDYDGTGSIRYDHQYDDLMLKDFSTDLSYRACAMKILYMQTYTLSDRDLQLRMQYGLNSARDSAMYTYSTTWLSDISTRGGSSLAYMKSMPLKEDISKLVATVANQTNTYMTAAVHCLRQSYQVAEHLAEAQYDEERDLASGF